MGYNLKDLVLKLKLGVFGKGIKFLGWIKKPNQKIKMLFIRPKNLILFRLQVFIIFYWSNGMAYLKEWNFCGHFLGLIFEDAYYFFEKRIFNFNGKSYWKCKASSKNNALFYLVITMYKTRRIWFKVSRSLTWQSKRTLSYQCILIWRISGNLNQD